MSDGKTPREVHDECIRKGGHFKERTEVLADECPRCGLHGKLIRLLSAEDK
jgi:hypothetical protein